MNRNLEDYVKVYNNHYDIDFCKRAVEELDNADFKNHYFHDDQTDSMVSHDKDLSISFHQLAEDEYLHEQTWTGIYNYIKELNFPWYNSWSGYGKIRFNRYRPGTQMNLHCDHIRTMFDGTIRGIPVLSIVGVLNEDYKGGEFIMWEDTEIILKTGDLLIFPSNFLYPHRVLELTKGVRNTFVSWVF